MVLPKLPKLVTRVRFPSLADVKSLPSGRLFYYIEKGIETRRTHGRAGSKSADQAGARAAQARKRGTMPRASERGGSKGVVTMTTTGEDSLRLLYTSFNIVNKCRDS